MFYHRPAAFYRIDMQRNMHITSSTSESRQLFIDVIFVEFAIFMSPEM